MLYPPSIIRNNDDEGDDSITEDIEEDEQRKTKVHSIKFVFIKICFRNL